MSGYERIVVKAKDVRIGDYLILDGFVVHHIRNAPDGVIFQRDKHNSVTYPSVAKVRVRRARPRVIDLDKAEVVYSTSSKKNKRR